MTKVNSVKTCRLGIEIKKSSVFHLFSMISFPLEDFGKTFLWSKKFSAIQISWAAYSDFGKLSECTKTSFSPIRIG
jgi:hypothetical protein